MTCASSDCGEGEIVLLRVRKKSTQDDHDYSILPCGTSLFHSPAAGADFIAHLVGELQSG